MWWERIRWWLWRRRRALKSQREENKILEDAAQQARMREKLFGSEWWAAQYRDDPGRCYEMRSVAELLGER